MERQTFVYVGLVTFVLVFGVSLLYFLFFSSGGPIASPETVATLEDCGVARYEGQNALNFVFFGEEREANRYADYLLEQEPFVSHREHFNVFFLDGVNVDPYCETYQGIALLCRDRGLIQAASSCPHDYIVVLDERPSSIRSSAYQNIMSLNAAHPLTVFAHEFGHVFANLAEEYVANTARVPRGSRNCVEDCSEFGDLGDGCYQGCSNNNLYRSVQNGVMRTLTPPQGVLYGSFNEKLIGEQIEKELSSLLATITGSVARITGRATLEETARISCRDREYVLHEVEYKNGVFSLVSQEVLSGCAGVGGVGEFGYELEDRAGGVLYSRTIEPFEVHTIAPGEVDAEGFVGIESDVDEIDEGNFFISAPLTGNVANLRIADSEGSELDVDLTTAGGRPCII